MIPYSRQKITQADLDAVLEALQSNYLTTGPLIEEFESELSKLTGVKYVVACSNGTGALHLACLSLGLPDNTIGLTSAITFVASANCLEYCNLRTDFIDINPSTLCISISELENYCKKKRPGIVIAVSFAGIPADLPRLYELSKQYEFILIEDAAHSLGSTYNYNGETFASGSCCHSDLAIFSFHPVKTITTGEGGAVLVNDKSLFKKLRELRTHGINKDPLTMSKNDGPWYYEMNSLGFNYRITDFQCALGLSQLRRLDQIKEAKRKIVDRYRQNLFGLKNCTLPPVPEGTSPCYHLFPIQLMEGSSKRLALYRELLKNGFGTQVHYIPVYWQPYYRNKYGYELGKCPESERYYGSTLSLPLFPELEIDKVDRISEIVKSIL